MKFKKSTVKAYNLLQDDWMKIGGTMYRIVKIEPNSFGRDNIAFYLRPITAETTHEDVRLSLPTLLELTIYNQK